jgi:hypothetical protein
VQILRTIIEKEIPKLCSRPQSRLNSCLYPNSAKMPSSASSTASEALLALETLLSMSCPWSAGASVVGDLLSAMAPGRLYSRYQYHAGFFAHRQRSIPIPITLTQEKNKQKHHNSHARGEVELLKYVALRLPKAIPPGSIAKGQLA